ncbi:unnamed protein product, partial [Callosobruchus maculatus]
CLVNKYVQNQVSLSQFCFQFICQFISGFLGAHTRSPLNARELVFIQKYSRVKSDKSQWTLEWMMKRQRIQLLITNTNFLLTKRILRVIAPAVFSLVCTFRKVADIHIVVTDIIITTLPRHNPTLTIVQAHHLHKGFSSSLAKIMVTKNTKATHFSRKWKNWLKRVMNLIGKKEPGG